MKEINSKINETIANNISKIRKDKKYNKKIVSDISRIKYATYYKLETNRKTILAIDIAKLANCFDVDVNELFKGTKEFLERDK